jgi:hypothetical protein
VDPDPWIRIRTKISWIRNTDFEPKNLFIFLFIGGGVPPSSSRVGWDRTAWFLDAKENSEGSSLRVTGPYIFSLLWIRIHEKSGSV